MVFYRFEDMTAADKAEFQDVCSYLNLHRRLHNKIQCNGAANKAPNNSGVMMAAGWRGAQIKGMQQNTHPHSTMFMRDHSGEAFGLYRPKQGTDTEKWEELLKQEKHVASIYCKWYV